MEKYPEVATERFDKANFHINYCLSFFKKFMKGNILEVGAGCGSFTKFYHEKYQSPKSSISTPKSSTHEHGAKYDARSSSHAKHDENVQQVKNYPIRK